MRHATLSVFTAAVVALLLFACDKEGDAAPPVEHSTTHAKQAGSAEAHTHAPEGAQPGSHEDWCGEHQVPESLCTRCNPALIAAFKATGDWCQEHGLPESQCLICNPDLKIERPPKTEGASP